MRESRDREYEVGDFFQVEYGQRVEDKAEEYFEAEEDAAGREPSSMTMSGSSMMIVMGSGDDVVPRDA
jgi:hypothetical protein